MGNKLLKAKIWAYLKRLLHAHKYWYTIDRALEDVLPFEIAYSTNGMLV
jgi:hypothetical protein